ncbi:hypothetical protein [Homoserinibacter gongjuensis]|uniref:ROK family protein n=1 Tax=Homoserinibacter gongjuensis TaxID=1162968 RepID=A0ABQ6JUR3_9MICO|nr:hypothetical protein [Homoserinibacter gongjuensis]GMA91014.1 hypothetical protein GCM10025869_15430 [Homoserinibacter gongjuensis]
MDAALALDIGGTKLAAGVVTSDGAVHGFTVEPTHRDQGPDVILPGCSSSGAARWPRRRMPWVGSRRSASRAVVPSMLPRGCS